MRRFLSFIIFFLNLTLIETSSAQVLLNESFNLPEKGAWGSAVGIQTDLSNIDWTLDIQNCVFVDEGDYAKTVSTSGGRFEVLDSDGEVVWISKIIDIHQEKQLQITFTASETGSNTSVDKKYVTAFLRMADGTEIPFSQNGQASGNWNTTTFNQIFSIQTSFQLLVKMNSSYASDKIYIDNIQIEALKIVSQIPDFIAISPLPAFTSVENEFIFSASIYDSLANIIPEKNVELKLETTAQSQDLGFSNGLYRWKVTFNQAGTVALRVFDTSNIVKPIETQIEVFSESNRVMRFDFETANLDDWESMNHWEISTVNPISGASSVRHLEQTANGTSTLIKPNLNIDAGSANYYFSFKLRNGDWDPSSSNGFYVSLLQRNFLTNEISNETANGYVIGVNASGSSDKVSLWSYENGKVTDMLAETNFDWDANTLARIDLSQLTDGTFTLMCTNLNNGNTSAATTINLKYNTFNEFGLHFFYTSTRSGKLWFDDFEVYRKNTGPQIRQINQLSPTQFYVNFTEYTQTEHLTLSDFKLTDDKKNTINIEKLEAKGGFSVLLTTQEISSAQLILTALNLIDIEGAQTPISTFNFEYQRTHQPFEIIFTEIFADPTPVVGLPNAEFIEIFNRTSKPISLENWILKVDNTSRNLSKETLAPQEYAILCHGADSILFAPFGKVIIVDRFQELRNSWAKLMLLSPKLDTIDAVTYYDSWYANAIKKNGGWSLERIDNERFCGETGNWCASIAKQGGTPAAINSICASNPDSIGPILLNAQVNAINSVKLNFNEALSPNNFSTLNIQLSDALTLESTTWIETENALQLKFNQSLKENKTYQITFNTLFDDCGNETSKASAKFSFINIKPGDVLINEVLFDPYTGGADFVELYNNTQSMLDLSKLKLATRDKALAIKSIYALKSNLGGFAAESYLAITSSFQGVANFYHLPCLDCVTETNQLPTYANEAGTVVLLNDSLEVIDEFSYTKEMHSKMISNVEGVSLERISLKRPSNLQENWHSASSTVGYATPGYQNSQEEGTSSNPQVILSCDVVSPNNDHYNDELVITLELPQDGCMANVILFDINGRKISQLANNMLIGTRETFVFSGKTNQGTSLPAGLYVFLIEVYHPKGFTFSKKMAIAIAP